MYAKGGSAYMSFSENEIFDCGTGGFTAGQGSGMEFAVLPWVHYQAYAITVTQNLIHNTNGAGLGVNGGFNIVMAFNTLYHIGTVSHAIEVVFGSVGCDGYTDVCTAQHAAGKSCHPRSSNLALGDWVSRDAWLIIVAATCRRLLAARVCMCMCMCVSVVCIRWNAAGRF